MSSPATPESGENEAPARRRYHSPLRRERAAQTRERIVKAGSDLVHGFKTWDWKDLTFRAVAERAGVGERTVYRHFPTERELHDAVMARLDVEAGVDYDTLELDAIADVAGRTFSALSTFAVPNWATPELEQEALVAEDAKRRSALMNAVAEHAGEWSDQQQRMAAAMLDIVWGVPAYERMITAWKLDHEEATQTISWALDMLSEAIREGRQPGA